MFYTVFYCDGLDNRHSSGSVGQVSLTLHCLECLVCPLSDVVSEYFFYVRSQPQNSMPDVVIWMISGEKRLAYHRIPANEVLWSNNPDYIGRLCGRLQSLQLKVSTIFINHREVKWSITPVNVPFDSKVITISIKVPLTVLIPSSPTFTLYLQFPGIKAEKEKISEVPALLRIKIWLGLANEDDAWHRMQTEGELAVFAETVSTSC